MGAMRAGIAQHGVAPGGCRSALRERPRGTWGTMDGQTFGSLLREARQESRLTLERLSEAAGLSVRAISDMERGRSRSRGTFVVAVRSIRRTQPSAAPAEGRIAA
ncbi:helix-turn-helix transcriptional regulator (plasmid) [Streptomyces sp. Q6]|uniref:Helix-turn-helix transcriptional regulator n=1 Tax=Streptomyces citrinus TaxID=3118173 RepID=A0ACD5AQS0_9ACTN